MIPKRPDGRPEAYDVVKNPEGQNGYRCHRCPSGVRYSGGGDVFMLVSDETRDGAQPGDTRLDYVCKRHLPDNTVIFNPATGTCRNKTGDQTWREDAPPDHVPLQ